MRRTATAATPPAAAAPPPPPSDPRRPPGRAAAPSGHLLLTTVLLDERAELAARLVEPRPHGGHRHALQRRDLLAAIALDLEQHERGAPRLVHAREQRVQHPPRLL